MKPHRIKLRVAVFIGALALLVIVNPGDTYWIFTDCPWKRLGNK
jgi:hypothetical protein